MLQDENTPLKKVILCPPQTEYFRAEDPTRHNFPGTPDREESIRQHRALHGAILESGARVVEAPELAGHPNSVFTRDTAVCTPKGYVLMRMGLESRRGEEAWIGGILDSIGEPRAGAIEPPGTVEGGDVFLCGEIALVGESGRTNREGVEQISALLGGMGYDVRVAKVPPGRLHLGSILSPVGKGAVLCCRGLLPDSVLEGFRRVEIEEGPRASANVLCLGGGRVVADAANRAGVEALEAAGFQVRALNLSEFEKGGGGPTCLTLPVVRSGSPPGE